MGLGEKSLEDRDLSKLCPHVCVPVTSFTLQNQVANSLSNRLLDREHIQGRNSFVLISISLEFSMQPGMWKMHNIPLLEKNKQIKKYWSPQQVSATPAGSLHDRQPGTVSTFIKQEGQSWRSADPIDLYGFSL